MTKTDIAIQKEQVRELTGIVEAHPATAAPLLKLLETARNDPEKLLSLTSAVLPAIPAAEPAPYRAGLVKEFGIEVVGEGKVWLTLGKTSRIAFLRKVQRVAWDLYGRPAIEPKRLEKWATQTDFTEPAHGGEIGVDGNVANSTLKTRVEQQVRGWNDVDLCDLAVAHAAYFLVTKKDLFAGNQVRARGGSLYFFNEGLDLREAYGDHDRSTFIAASTALSSREWQRWKTNRTS